MTKEEIQNIYDYSKSKFEICQKLNIRTNQNSAYIDNNILEYFSQIDINKREQISKKNLSKHWLEIQKRDYELNPRYCAWCGKKLPFERRYSKCCNQSCGSAFGNKNKGSRNEETKRKISYSLKEGIKCHKYILANQYGVYKYGDENIKTPHKVICQYCGKEFMTLTGTLYCSKECKTNGIHDKLSKAVKEQIKNGTFQGWKSRNVTSYAEKFWKQVLDNNNIEYIKEYSLKRKNNQSYFLDFYIEIGDRKIDLEIDGKQHLYEDRKELDKIRDEYIRSKGIEVYRIPWNSINSENGKQLMKEKIDNFLKYIK